MDIKTTYLRKIFSQNEKEVLAALETISEKGYPEIVTDLIKLFNETEFDSIRAHTLYILNNLKDKNSVPHYMTGLSATENDEKRKDLISACWQNGLDFSPYLSYFLEIIAHKEFTQAIEAFSVIENNLGLIDDKETSKLLDLISKTKTTGNIKNTNLFLEVEKMLL